MAIKGLTDKKSLSLITRQLPEAGIFWKGEERQGNRPGKDLEDGSWRIEWKGNYDNENIRSLFAQIIPDTAQPILIATIGNTIDACLDDYNRLYGGNNALKRLCDGEKILFSANKGEDKCLDCPAREIANADLPKDERAKDICQPMGYFRFTIPQLNVLLGHQVQFRFNITSENELKQFAKELESTLAVSGKLVNEVFFLQRNLRTFNKDLKGNGQMSKINKSLAMLVAFPFDLDELTPKSANNNQLEDTPLALPEGATDEQRAAAGEIDDSLSPENRAEKSKSDYIDFVTEVANKWLGMDLDTFLFQFGTLPSVDKLYEDVPDIEQLKTAIVQWVVNTNTTIRIYACNTYQSGKTKVMKIPFKFGTATLGSRKGFGENLSEKAHSAYALPDGKMNNLTQDGWHKFKDVFNLDYLSMNIGLTKTGKIKILEITDDIPF